MTFNFNKEDYRKKNEEDDDKKAKTGLPLSYWLKQRKIMINLAVMIIVWLTCSFNFYLIMFLLTSFD